MGYSTLLTVSIAHMMTNFLAFWPEAVGNAQSFSSGANGFFFTIHWHFPGESVLVSLFNISVCPKLNEADELEVHEPVGMCSGPPSCVIGREFTHPAEQWTDCGPVGVSCCAVLCRRTVWLLSGVVCGRYR